MSGFFSPSRAHKKSKSKVAPSETRRRAVSPGFVPNSPLSAARKANLTRRRRNQRNRAAAAVEANRHHKLNKS